MTSSSISGRSPLSYFVPLTFRRPGFSSLQKPHSESTVLGRRSRAQDTLKA